MNESAPLPKEKRKDLAAEPAEETRTRRALLHMLEDLQRERDAVRQAKRQWIETVDSVRDPLMVHDDEYRIVRANKAYAARAGMPVAEVIGKPYWLCFPRRDGPLPGCSAAMADAQAGGPVHEEEVVLESGEIFTSRVFQVREAGSAGMLALHLFEDVTEKRRTQEELAHRERYYRRLIEGSADAFFVIDRSGAVIYRSDSGKRLTGLDTEQVLGKPVTNFVHPDDIALARSAIAETQQSAGGSTKVELRLLRGDGTPVEVEVHGRNLLDDPDVGGIVVTARDITERKRAEEALRRLNRSLRTLSAGNEALVRATDESGLLAEMTRIIVEIGGYASAFVGYALDDADKTIEPKASAGTELSTLRAARISWGDNERGQHVMARAIRSRSPQVMRELAEQPGFAPWRDVARARRFGALLGLPLCPEPGGQALGAIGIAAADADAFDAEELKLLVELAGDLAYGIANLRTGIERRAAAEQMRRGLESTIGAIAATVEMRDPYTAGHQRRVAWLAAAIAREMGLPQQIVEGVHFGALIHDLGKIQVPAEILAKPTRLSSLELQLIRMHAQAGYEILKDIEFPWPVAQMVCQHHERIDGSGYPNGLAGEHIVLEARVLAVADVVEAMSSHRPYRAGLGIELALQEIEQNRNRTYDAQAVDACLRLFRDKHFEFQPV